MMGVSTVGLRSNCASELVSHTTETIASPVGPESKKSAPPSPIVKFSRVGNVSVGREEQSPLLEPIRCAAAPPHPDGFAAHRESCHHIVATGSVSCAYGIVNLTIGGSPVKCIPATEQLSGVGGGVGGTGGGGGGGGTGGPVVPLAHCGLGVVGPPSTCKTHVETFARSVKARHLGSAAHSAQHVAASPIEVILPTAVPKEHVPLRMEHPRREAPGKTKSLSASVSSARRWRCCRCMRVPG
mmetsp:Transcript_28520/g.74913  ORF Transcript_28520/g.74913 Transcript_28520/m.74913 type:complete len:241 (-) Transcript_28520:1269-1991(-)